jgi:hypothetical protein
MAAAGIGGADQATVQAASLAGPATRAAVQAAEQPPVQKSFLEITEEARHANQIRIEKTLAFGQTLGKGLTTEEPSAAKLTAGMYRSLRPGDDPELLAQLSKQGKNKYESLLSIESKKLKLKADALPLDVRGRALGQALDWQDAAFQVSRPESAWKRPDTVLWEPSEITLTPEKNPYFRELTKSRKDAPLFSGFLAPEVSFTRDQAAYNMWAFNMQRKREIERMSSAFKGKAAKVLDTFKIGNEDYDTFIAVVEGNLTPAELKGISPRIVQAAVKYKEDVTDPLWNIAKKYDPDLAYRKREGYFTHFTLKSTIDDLDRSVSTAEVIGAASNDVKRSVELSKTQKTRLENTERELSTQRNRATPGGGFFGPLNELRKTDLPYAHDVRAVTDRYINGAMRKVYLDSFLPQAKALYQQIDPSKPALKMLAYDYITSQRGMLGAGQDIKLGAALKNISFISPQWAGRMERPATDLARFVTGLQYTLKVGLSWIRFPMTNLTQPLLTTAPLVGPKAFVKGLATTIFDPDSWRLAEKMGVLHGVEAALAETTEHFANWQNKLAFPARLSEKFNIVLSFNAGRHHAVELGLGGRQAIRHAEMVVSRTQFRYGPEAMSIVSQRPLGKTLMQFRSFTNHYAAFLHHLWQTDKMKFAGALGSLFALSGTTAIPLYSFTRRELLKHGMELPEINPLESATRWMGVGEGVDIATSLEPFNIPTTPEYLLGPTAGPITDVGFKSLAGQGKEALGKAAKNVAPSLSRVYTRVVEGAALPDEAEGKIFTPSYGRVVGQRSPLETAYLRPPAETVRYHYLEGIRAAVEAVLRKRMTPEKAREFIRRTVADAKAENIFIGSEDISNIRQQLEQKIMQEQMRPGIF